MHAPLADSREVTPPRSTPVAATSTFAAVVGASHTTAANDPLASAHNRALTIVVCLKESFAPLVERQTMITREKSFEEIGTPTVVPCYKSDEERQGLVQLGQLAFVMFGLLLNAIASFVCGILSAIVAYRQSPCNVVMLAVSDRCPEHYRYLPVYLITVGILFLFIASTYVAAMACADCLCCLVCMLRKATKK